MSLVRSSAITFNSGTTTTAAYSPAAFTPPAGAMIVVICHIAESSGTTDPSGLLTLTDSQGLTWTKWATIGDPTSWSTGLAIFTSSAAAAVSTTLVFDCGPRNVGYSGTIVSYTGYDAATPVGATGTFSNNGPLSGTVTLTLSNAVASTSETIAAIDTRNPNSTSSITAGSGFTVLRGGTAGTNPSQNQVRPAGSTSNTAEWTGLLFGSVDIIASAIEIRAAGGGGAARAMHHYRLRRTA